MCSIFGQISFKNKLINKENFINASSLLQHRGPDKNGYKSDNLNYQFAFNRLAIIDLNDTGDQPMVSGCGRYVCIFNGEIYNHKQIFSIIEKNFKWRGTSDTEILVNAWSLWEKETLDKIDGMYAFAIWDNKEKKIIIARDRFGEKPLYFMLDNNNSLFFSSRPAPIIKIFPDLKNKFDENGLKYFNDAGFFPKNQSVYKNIKKLEPGSILEFKSNEIYINKYWSINSFITKNLKKKKLSHYVEELENLLTESISDRLISDKPVGFLLSGGIDSSLITSIAAKITNKDNINAFNLGFDDQNHDESKDAEMVANYLKIKLNKKILLPSQLIDLLPEFFKKFDEPFSDPASFPLMAISEFAKTKVDVVLTGDGGDELFGGYNNYTYMVLLKKFNIILSLVKNTVLPNLFKKYGSHKIRLLGNLFNYNDNISRFAFIRSARKDFMSVYDNSNQTEMINSYLKDDIDLNNEFDFMNKIMKLDIINTLNNNYLQKTDLSTMAYSLECRSPFLSKKIIEWSLTIPSKFKVNFFNKKIILKELAKKFLPNRILTKKKQGFEPPIKNWLKNDLKQWSLDIINNEKNYENLKIDKNRLLNLFNLHLSGKRDCHPYLWATLMIMKFNEQK